MKKRLFSSSLLLTVSLFTACESDGGRMQLGIQDPIERHPKKSWTWPFGGSRKSAPAPRRAPNEDAFQPAYQPLEGTGSD